jgi:hypothetical protein
MRQPNENWTEFDWEGALRESDEMAERYFRLLQRFSDLPSADELIARHMGPDFDGSMLDMESDDDSPLHEWPDEDNAGAWHDHAAGQEPADNGGEEPEQEQPLFYETDPVFVALRQNAVGWCNVYAAILPREARARGLQVLYHLGRALANLAYSIDDGTYEQPAASIAFGKRSLASLNLALRELDLLIHEHRRLHQLLKTMRKHLIECVDRIVDHIGRCRNRQKGRGAGSSA